MSKFNEITRIDEDFKSIIHKVRAGNVTEDEWDELKSFHWLIRNYQTSLKKHCGGRLKG